MSTVRGAIPGLAALGVVVPDEAEVDVDLTLSSYPGGIMAAGRVSAPWVGECRRCGGRVSGTVVSSVQERFVPTGGSAQDEDAYPLSGDELDLEPLARDSGIARSAAGTAVRPVVPGSLSPLRWQSEPGRLRLSA